MENDWGGLDQKNTANPWSEETIRREKQRKIRKLYIYIYTSDIEIKI